MKYHEHKPSLHCKSLWITASFKRINAPRTDTSQRASYLPFNVTQIKTCSCDCMRNGYKLRLIKLKALHFLTYWVWFASPSFHSQLWPMWKWGDQRLAKRPQDVANRLRREDATGGILGLFNALPFISSHYRASRRVTQRFSATVTEVFVHPHLFQSISSWDGPGPAVNAFQNILIPLISVSLVAPYRPTPPQRAVPSPWQQRQHRRAVQFCILFCSHTELWMHGEFKNTVCDNNLKVKWSSFIPAVCKIPLIDHFSAGE